MVTLESRSPADFDRGPPPYATNSKPLAPLRDSVRLISSKTEGGYIPPETSAVRCTASAMAAVRGLSLNANTAVELKKTGLKSENQTPAD